MTPEHQHHPTIAADDALNVIRIPVILLVGGSAALAVRCRKAAARSRILVRACDAAVAWETAGFIEPLAIVVPAELYARGPVAFDRLAASASATLVSVESADLLPVELEWRLLHAICETARVRGF